MSKHCYAGIRQLRQQPFSHKFKYLSASQPIQVSVTNITTLQNQRTLVSVYGHNISTVSRNKPACKFIASQNRRIVSFNKRLIDALNLNVQDGKDASKSTKLPDALSSHQITSSNLQLSDIPNSKTSHFHFGFSIVPQQQAYVIERLGKFDRILEAGFHVLIPVIDRIAYKHSLKETALLIPNQSAITKDNVMLTLDGVLYIKVNDPYEASYGVESVIFAVTQLAQTTMRSEIGKLTLDDTFLERDLLNTAINRAINSAASVWGVQCLRYEIKDIQLPPTIKQTLEKQAEAERRKRAEILFSEGEKQSQINLATGRKTSIELQAQADAFAILAKAKATADGIEAISSSLNNENAEGAITLQLAEKYINAFGNLAKESTTILLPCNTNNVSSAVSEATAIYASLKERVNKVKPTIVDTTKFSEESADDLLNIFEPK